MENAMLIVGHPGHELRVHGWLERVRSTVFVLTDGSGHRGRSRLEATSRILARAGATPGGVYGRLTDAALYEAILGHDVALFRGLVEELSDAMIRMDVAYVAGDASEGYNSGHEVCRLLIDAAVARAERVMGRRVPNYDFPLVGPPDECPASVRAQAIRLELDDAALARKLAAAHGYAEIADDVNAALDERGAEAFRIECLRPVMPGSVQASAAREMPYYEYYGEQQVAAGYYQRVLRYREDLAPLAAALGLV